MGIKNRAAMMYHGFTYIIRNIRAISSGQAYNYSILQFSHRLEKGLCIRNPRSGWGYDKADKLIDFIMSEKKQKTPDYMAIHTGEAVLAAFIEEKKNYPEEKDKVQSLEKRISEENLNINLSNNYGGTLNLTKEDVLSDDSFEQLFLSRHSIRDFDETPIDICRLERAIFLALHAPSACNRQASQIYVISGYDRIKAGSSNEYNADKYLIITGNMRAYSLSELNDWVVSTSVFCGYLSLALHAEGIGSCIFRKDIVQKSKYNDAIRSICHIPDDEQIILEMAIGNYRDEFKVPVSYRKEVNEVLHYIRKE